MEKAVAIGQFFIYIQVFRGEMKMFLRIHICNLIRENVERRNHADVVDIERTLIISLLVTLMNLTTQEKHPRSATFMRNPSVIA